MEIAEIMNLISDERLIELGREYNVDKKNHKITGAFILKSFVHSSLLDRAISLRSLELSAALDCNFNSLLKSKKGSKTVDHSSIGKRLQTIKVEYFIVNNVVLATLLFVAYLVLIGFASHA